MSRPYIVYQYEKTVIPPLLGNVIQGVPYLMQPDGFVYVWNNTYGHGIVDLYSGKTTLLPVPSFTSGAYGADSSTDRLVYFNRLNGNWTYLAFDAPNFTIYAVTNWAGIIRIGAVNTVTQKLPINGVDTVAAHGDFPRFVNAWLNESVVGFKHIDGTFRFLNLISLTNSQASPGAAPAGLLDWIGGYDGNFYAQVTGDLSAGGYPYGNQKPQLPQSYGGSMYGGIGDYNQTYDNIIIGPWAATIYANASFAGGVGPLDNASKLWENGYPILAAYCNPKFLYFSGQITIAAPYRGQPAIIRGNAVRQSPLWDIYVPGSSPRLELVQFPRLTNYSRPISPIGAWEA